jgi:uncharacterized membrane protein
VDSTIRRSEVGDITQSVDVAVDVSTAYNQWTQFEEFPRFMEGVETVEQIDDRRLRWKVDIAGVEREFEAEITEQTPDQRIAWRSRTGVDQGGVVTFHALDDDHTRVTLQMALEPEGVAEQFGDKMGVVSARTKGDLNRFKEFVEERGSETGAWRGEIDREN